MVVVLHYLEAVRYNLAQSIFTNARLWLVVQFTRMLQRLSLLIKTQFFQRISLTKDLVRTFMRLEEQASLLFRIVFSTLTTTQSICLLLL